MNVSVNEEQISKTLIVPKLLVGTDDFRKLLLESDIYVDKTMLIKAFVENSSETVLITRPRRWGKSMNLDMIAKFLTVEVDDQGNLLPAEKRQYTKLFTGGEVDLGFATGETKLINQAKIAAYPDFIAKHQGKYPVIYLNFKETKADSYQNVAAKIKHEITRMFGRHNYLLNSTKLNDEEKAKIKQHIEGDIDLVLMEFSIQYLSEMLEKHFNTKVYILVDEYDAPINDAYIQFYQNKKSEFDHVIRLFQGLFGAALKTNTSLKKGLVTGILRVAKANIFSGINNLGEDCILDEEFAPYYGFTEDEVEQLLAHSGFASKSSEIKKWYNGYQMGGQTIYNPWSIMQCLSKKGRCDTYWVDSGGTGLLDKVLLSDGVQEELQMLLEDQPLVKRVVKQIAFDEFETNNSIFYSLLLFAGYLNAQPENEDYAKQTQIQTYYLTIPNLELKNIYADRVISWIARKLKIPGGDYEFFIRLLLDKKLDLFFQNLAKHLRSSTSFHDLISERDYHNLMGGLLTPLITRYNVQSNRESGLGRFDHLLIPLWREYDTAFIFEYKLSKDQESMQSDADKALAQINDNHYDADIKNHPQVKFITKIGMAFCGKEFKINITTEVAS